MHFSSSLKYIFITFYPFILSLQYGLSYLNNNQADVDEKHLHFAQMHGSMKNWNSASI